MMRGLCFAVATLPLLTWAQGASAEDFCVPEDVPAPAVYTASCPAGQHAELVHPIHHCDFALGENPDEPEASRVNGYMYRCVKGPMPTVHAPHVSDGDVNPKPAPAVGNGSHDTPPATASPGR